MNGYDVYGVTWLQVLPFHICYDFQGIQMMTKKTLCNIKGISEGKVEKIKEAAGKVSGVRHVVFMSRLEKVFFSR